MLILLVEDDPVVACCAQGELEDAGTRSWGPCMT
jgi:hypothetical protein